MNTLPVIPIFSRLYVDESMNLDLRVDRSLTVLAAFFLFHKW